MEILQQIRFSPEPPPKTLREIIEEMAKREDAMIREAKASAAFRLRKG